MGLGLPHPGNKWSHGQSDENLTFSYYFRLISVSTVNMV